MTESAVRDAFRSQAETCTRLGSAFTGRLCAVLATLLDRHTAIGRRILDWPGNPAATQDNVPLRLCGGLHALVRSARAPSLAALYPPAPLPEAPLLAEAVAESLQSHGEWLDGWLDHAPQTNEVGRSAVLMAGLLVLADRFRLPIRLFELGASAGLNLQLDRFGYALGGRSFGDPRSKVQLRPGWEGPPPPEVEVEIVERQGVDLSPIDPARDGDRLLAYVWPDQPERLARIKAAIDIASRSPIAVVRGDAADWLEQAFTSEPVPGNIRVVLHSIAFQYFPQQVQQRIRAQIEKAGALATEEAPVAWLRFEMLAGESSASLRLRSWPGDEQLLAWAHPHASEVRWLGH